MTTTTTTTLTTIMDGYMVMVRGGYNIKANGDGKVYGKKTKMKRNTIPSPTTVDILARRIMTNLLVNVVETTIMDL